MKVLIVDDDSAVVDFFCQVLEMRDITDPDTAGSGEEAMGRVVNEQYDLITLDIRMPGASGLDILSMVRNMCPHAIIAVISGNFPEDILEQTAMCADVMIEKPVKLDTLLKLVDSAEQIKGRSPTSASSTASRSNRTDLTARNEPTLQGSSPNPDPVPPESSLDRLPE